MHGRRGCQPVEDPQDVGATHGAELPFTFNRFNSEDPGASVFYDAADPVVRNLFQRWSDTIIAFARTGEPNGAGLPHWPRYDSASRRTLVLDDNPRVEADLNREERELWEGVLGEGDARVVWCRCSAAMACGMSVDGAQPLARGLNM